VTIDVDEVAKDQLGLNEVSKDQYSSIDRSGLVAIYITFLSKNNLPPDHTMS
jgi:hypothetical protein